MRLIISSIGGPDFAPEVIRTVANSAANKGVSGVMP